MNAEESGVAMSREWVGIEIGGSKLQIVKGSADGAIGERRRFRVDPAQGAAVLRVMIEQTLLEWALEATLTPVGVGFGGPVDWRTGRICCSHHVEGWAGFALGEWLSQKTGGSVQIENDANVAALAEAVLGAGRGFDPVFFVTLGSGVGGGLVAGGTIYHGAPPGEAEIGHVRLDRAGATVESRCAGWSVDRKIRAHIAEHPTGELARMAGETTGGEARWLSAALAAGDEGARGILQTTAEDLAFGLSHAVHLFHPAVLVLGGGLALLGEPLRSAVATALPAFLMQALQPGPEVRLAALGEDVVPTGALLLAGRAASTEGVA